MFIIREALETDASSFGNVHVASWRAAYKNIVPDEYLDRMNPDMRAQGFIQEISSSSEKRYHVAENNSAVIGNLVIGRDRESERNDVGEIGSIYLLPEFGGSGHGKSMMDFSIKKLRGSGYKTVVIWVLEKNKRARRFYEKSGFVISGRKKEITLGKPLVVIEYTKKI